MTVRVSGLRATFGAVDKDIKSAANREIEKRTAAAYQKVIADTPVDTGDLKAGWSRSKHTNPDGLDTHVVRNDVEHASYVELGSSTRPPTHFIRQAFMRFFTNVSVDT